MLLHLLPTTLLIATTTALQLSDFHLPISLSDYFPTRQHIEKNSGQSAASHELLRRQASASSCPNKYNSCSNLGAPGLCCDPSAVCSADAAGHVACCPSGAACSGVIGGVITAGTISNGVLVGGGAATTSANGAGGGLVTAAATTTTSSYQNFQSASSTTNGGGLVAASGTATQSTVGGGGGFVIDGSSTVATPGAGMRRAEVPLVARALLRVLEYLPV